MQLSWITDIETLANQMSLPYGGISFILWPQREPDTLVRVQGGLSFEHVPIQKAFNNGHARASFELAKITQSLLSELAQPEQDVIIDNAVMSSGFTNEPSLGATALILRIETQVEGEWKKIAQRPFLSSSKTEMRFLRSCCRRGCLTIHLLQGPRPQHVGKITLKITKLTVARLLKYLLFGG